ncbi:hypothetical protein EW145_g3639 [Phellinidium pouzarii]|uniref:DUF6534 domain-containing protein n=1 Tax=Phellinidium pouzarii TaxID=167371 RepID=A0A4S4L6C9_9AGAM|nr:hypothetical protein EW145_g3639 [Phellinidium pouzarii]
MSPDFYGLYSISEGFFDYEVARDNIVISSFANPAALEYGIWSLYLSIGVNVSIAFVVQCFFIHKIHGLSGRNWYLTGPLSIVVLLHLAFGFETMAEFFIKKRLNSLAQLTYIAALPFAVAAVLSDIAIVVALCLLLQHNKTSFRSTNVLLNYLIVYAINRCLLTSIVAISEVVVFATIPNSFWYLAIDFVVGKCYANSLLATLNSRSALRGKGFDNERNPDESSSDGVRFTSIEIAGVTPSMLPHSRAVTQNERVSLNSEASRSRTDVGLVELKDVKARTRDTSHLSAISMREESSSVNIEGDTLEYREP